MTGFHMRAAICALIVLCGLPFAAHSSPPEPDVLLQTMQHELKRASTSLAKSDPAPYYLAYAVNDGESTTLAGSDGGLIIATTQHRRQADVMMRVGSPALDNTHSQSRPSGITSGGVPLRDDPDALARVLWLLTDREYEQASSAFLRVKTNQAVQSAEEDKSPDFSQESPQTFSGPASAKVPDNLKPWEDRLRHVSARFLKYPEVYTSVVLLSNSSGRSYIATSEGAALEQSSATARLVIEGESRAEDGMELLRVETFQEASPDQLPSEAELNAKADRIFTALKARSAAPSPVPDGRRRSHAGTAQRNKARRHLCIRRRRSSCAESRRGRQRSSQKFSDVPHAHHRFRSLQWPRPPSGRPHGHWPPGQLDRHLHTHGQRFRAACEVHRRDQETEQALRPLLRGYSSRLHAHHARLASGFSGDSRDGVSHLS